MNDYEAMYSAMDELLPCPHCGQERIVPGTEVYDTGRSKTVLYYAGCIECKSRTGCFRTVAEAVSVWNRRTGEEWKQ